MTARDGERVIDLVRHGDGRGPVWGLATADLNATLLSWPPGHVVAEHRNDERDVLLVVAAGSVTVRLDGEPHALGAGQLIVLPRGSLRGVEAGPDGARYLSIHRRRDPLMPRRRPSGDAPSA